MKTLLLLRHAKSSWGNASLLDFDRPLAPRGIKDAPRIGRALRERGPDPEMVISSPAIRAVETTSAVVEAAGLGVTPQFDHTIYAASSGELMEVVNRIPDTVSCAMLVGHNPGFEDLSERLTGMAEHLSTAALVCIKLQSPSWADVKEGDGELVWMITPRLLGGSGGDRGGDNE